MIEKLLNVARYDAGSVVVQKQVVRLSDLVQAYLSSNKAFFADLGYHIDVTCSSNESVCIDTESFATIIRNLVDNAVKYSEQQRNIHLRVFRAGLDLVFEVEDFGIGIPEDQQALVFNKFYRVEDPMTATTKGHGLGLAIVKHLTELNGGVISLKSQYGYGSTFTVRFPIWNAETKSKTEPTPLLEVDTVSSYAIQR
jgi:two-component system sensor histidine kinase/response regulator